MLTLKIKSVNDEIEGFGHLVEVFNKIIDNPFETFNLDLSECLYIRPNMLSPIGALLFEAYNSCPSFILSNFSDIPPQVSDLLDKTGFLETIKTQQRNFFNGSINFDFGRFKDIGTASKYVHLRLKQIPNIHMDEIVLRGLVNKISECFLNITEHSIIGDDIFYVSSHYSRKNSEFKFTISDNGIGIPTNVRTVDACQEFDDSECLRWAFTMSNSSKNTQDSPHGLGLHILNEFISLNGGKIEILSGEGYLESNGHNVSVKKLDFTMCGTIVNITIKCKNKRYYLTRKGQ